MIKVEFFKSVEDLKVIEKGAAVAYYADHTHFRHFSEMLGCFVGKTTLGFDLVPISNFRQLRALDKYSKIYIVPSFHLMPTIALNVNEAKTTILLDLTGFDKIPAALPKFLQIHKCDLKALLAQRPNVRFIVDSQSIQGFEFIKDLPAENVLAFSSSNQAKALLSNSETVLVATFDKNISREMYALLFRPKEVVEMVVVPRTTNQPKELTIETLEEIPDELF